MKQTVFVVDDDEAVRDALSMLMHATGLEVETFPSAAAFLNSYRLERPGCLLLDVRMPGTSGLALQQELMARRIGIPIVFLTGHADVPLAVQAMKQGAYDFIEKPIASPKLIPAIKGALAFDAERRQRAAAGTVPEANVSKLLSTLSEREHEVLNMVLEGKQTRVIAESLGITVKTVEFHRAKLREKLGVNSMAELFRLLLGNN